MTRLAALCYLLLFIHSTVHAQHWTKIQTDIDMKYELFMVDEQYGYTYNTLSKLKTTDGGSTWDTIQASYSSSNQNFLLFNSMITTDIHFFNRNEGYITGRNTDYIIAAKTTDGSANWEIPYKEPKIGYDEGILDMYFISSTKGVMVGDNGRIIKTIDGTNWQKVTSYTSKKLNHVIFTDNLTGYIFGEYVMLTTQDGGNSWAVSSSEFDFNNVAFTPSGKWFGIDGSQIYSSTDLGKTWEKYFYSFPYYYFDIHFFDDDHGIITGNSSEEHVILSTTDGGNYWEPLTYNFDESIRDIQVLDNNVVYVNSLRGVIYKAHQEMGPIKPVPYFEYSDGLLCENISAPTEFKNYGTPTHSYEWWVDGIKKADTYDFAYTFQSSGNHTITLKAYTPHASDSVSQDFYIKPLQQFSYPIKITTNIYGDSTYIDSEIDFKIYNSYNYYHIELEGDTIAGPALSPSKFTITTPSAPGLYTYRIVNRKNTECGPIYQTLDTILKVMDVPFAPFELEASRLANNQVELKWKAYTDRVDEYIIERKAQSDVDFMEIGRLANQISLYTFKYLDTTLITHTKYEYRIKAVNEYGVSKPSNTAKIFIHGPIIYVKAGAHSTNNGSSWQDALPSLERAIEESLPENELWVAEGTYVTTNFNGFYLNRFTASGMFGGFAGTESSLDERNLKQHPTILTSPLSLLEILNVLYLSQGRIADGVIIENSKSRGVTVGENCILKRCIVQNNRSGITIHDNSLIDRCIIRNNGLTELDYLYSGEIGDGINISAFVKRAEISNSYIYNNRKYGVQHNDKYFLIYNCTFYANKKGRISPYSGSSRGGTNFIYNSLFGYSKDDPIIYTSIDRNCSFYQIDLGFMAGNDEILGNEDDIFNFSDTLLIDNGRNSIGNFRKNDEDFGNNPRIVGESIDIGAIEWQDTIPDPTPALSTQVLSPRQAKITWSTDQPDQYKFIIIERKADEFFEIVTRLPYLEGEFIDNDLLGDKIYKYRIRWENDSMVSMAGEAIPAHTHSHLDTIYATNISANHTRLQWSTQNNNIQKYIISRATYKPTYFTDLDTLDANIVSYDDSSLVQGKTYYYRLQTFVNDTLYQVNTIEIKTNSLPSLTNGSFQTYPKDTIRFNPEYFKTSFQDNDADSLHTVKFLSSDEAVHLYHHGNSVTLPFEIYSHELFDIALVADTENQDTLKMTYTASDGKDYTATGAQILLYVMPLNIPPVLSDIHASIAQKDTFKLSYETITNAFRDEDQHTLTSIKLLEWPDDLSVLFNDSLVTAPYEVFPENLSQLLFKANSDFVGTINIPYNCYDGTDYASENAEIILDITRANTHPVLSDIAIEIIQGDMVELSIEAILNAFQDKDQDTLTSIKLLNWPENLSAFLNDSLVTPPFTIQPDDLPKLIFQPDPEFSGKMTISYNCYDGANYSNNAPNIEINVLPINHAPEIKDIHLQSYIGDTIKLSEQIILSAFNDEDEDAIQSISLLSWPSGLLLFKNGSLLSAPAKFNFDELDNVMLVPIAGEEALYLPITVTDSKANSSNEASIVLTLMSQNHTPQITDLFIEINKGDSIYLDATSFLSAYKDVDGDTLTSIKLQNWDDKLNIYYHDQKIQSPFEIRLNEIKDLRIEFASTTTDTLQVSFQISDGNMYTPETYSIDLVLLYSLPFSIAGQSYIYITQDSTHTISLDDFTINHTENISSDDLTLTAFPGQNYNIDSLTITPTDNYVGTLIIPVKLNTGSYSAKYDLSITVIPTLYAKFEILEKEIREGDVVTFSNQSIGSPDSYQWLLPGANISSSDEKEPENIFYPEPGLYPITLTVSNDTQTSTYTDSIYVISNTVTGIEEVSSNTLAYPNPASTEIFINLEPTWLGGYYVVYDANSTNVKNGKISSTTLKLDISDFTTGKYFIILTQNNKRHLINFVKQN